MTLKNEFKEQSNCFPVLIVTCELSNFASQQLSINTCWIFQSIFHIFAELTLDWTWPQLSPKRAINCSFNRALGAGAGWHRVNGLKSWWELSTPPPKYFEIYPEDKNDLPPHSKHWISFYGLRLKLVFIVPYNSLVLNKQNLVCVTQRAPGAGYITVLPALAVTISHSAQLWDHTPGQSYLQSLTHLVSALNVSLSQCPKLRIVSNNSDL